MVGPAVNRRFPLRSVHAAFTMVSVANSLPSTSHNCISTNYQLHRPSRSQATLFLLVLAVVIGCVPFPPASVASASAPAVTAAAVAALMKVSTATQLVDAILDNGIPSVQLIANVRVDPSVWLATDPIIRFTNFTIVGADWYPILDLNFAENKIHLQPGVYFVFGQVELRNVRTRSGFELDIFDRSPNATVRYQQTVYFCFSCLPPSALVSAIYKYPPASLPNDVRNASWQRTQDPLQQSYGTGQAVLFATASTVMPTTGVLGATSGGGYELQAVDTLFVCAEPIDPAECESARGMDHCLSRKIEAMAAVDDTWRKLEEAAAERATATEAKAASGKRGGSSEDNARNSGAGITGSGGSRHLPVAAAVGGALGGTALLAAVAAAVVLHRRRCCHRRIDGAMANLTSVGGNGAPPPFEDSMAVKIVMVEEIGNAGDGNGDSRCKALPRSRDQQPSANGVAGNGHDQEAVPVVSSAAAAAAAAAAATAAAAAAATAAATATAPQSSHPHSPSHRYEGDAADSVVSTLDLQGTYPEVMAALADGGSLSISTLGESYQVPSSSESPSQWPRFMSMAPAMSSKSAGEERSQPVVVVAGITIELTNVIGTGSFGKVYKGSWQGRPVAVKVLQYGAELCRSVHSEVLLSQTLRHPNVVAALYFAQVLPGGKLGLQTSGGAGGATTSTDSSGAGPTPPPDRRSSDRTMVMEKPEAGDHVRTSGTGTGASPAGSYGVQGKRLNGCDGCGGGQEDAAAGRYNRSISLDLVQGSETMAQTAPAEALTGGSESGVVDFKAMSLPPNVCRSSGTSCGPDGGRDGGKQVGSNQGLPAPLSSQEAGNATAHLAGLAAAAADPTAGTAAETLGPRRDGRPTSTSQPGSERLELRGRAQPDNAPLMPVRLSELGKQEVTELSESAPDDTTGSSHAGDADTDATLAAAAAVTTAGDVAERCRSPLDVLSRWDEQRRRQEYVERTGAKLIGPEVVVSSNGFLMQAGVADSGGNACKTVVALMARDKKAPVTCEDGGGVGRDGSEASAGPRAKFASDGTGTTHSPSARCSSPTTPSPPSQPRHPLTTGPSTPADAAAVALPLEALWLAAYTQPAAGGSHGFLVMELCAGGSASAWRAASWSGPDERPDLVMCESERARARESVLLRLALDIAYGMSYIHSMGICHGDLKLSNVLLARSSDASALSRANPNDMLAGWVAKVCDFGLSRVLTGGRTHVSTRPYGTPTHMAPELWTKGHMSQPADVYAFGITLWELATGERPYKGLNAARILHRVLLNGDRPIMPLWLSPSYTRLVTSCWAQSPKDRPTFGEIVRHLEAMLAVLAAVTS
ncbi:hypothetical protein VaNZ11_009860 [Volvox africanus]|uniref:Protein kinase domain-containing protein n=1 Tax=Volvox africanus TaxID=51714 RepID=A0ABQ5S8A4_9CHLO|nr:hypothetical protein VaNZ11_009860 [Volvox africanus]